MTQSVACAGRKVLIVGRPSRERELTIEALAAVSYRVVVAESWMGAIALAAAHGPSIDLLVTDLRLPGIGGLALAERLRIILPTLPVVFTRWSDRPSRVDELRPPDPSLEVLTPSRLLEEVDALLAS